MNYAESLKEHRQSRNLSLMDIEKATGISNGSISRWENGQVIPGINFCIQLAQFYGISLDELVGLNDSPTHTNSPPVQTHHSTEISPEISQLASDKDFINAAKLYLALDEIKRIQIVSYITGIAQGAGLNIKKILGK